MNYGLATFNQHKFTVQNVAPVSTTLAATSSWVNITNSQTISTITLCGANLEGDVIFLTSSSNASIAVVSLYTLSPGRVLCLFRMGGSWYEAFRTALNGDTGNAGSNPIGATGSQGAQGNQNNEAGAPGTNGSPGAQGAPGDPGDTGSQGPQGA
jgi:hypothetical protein